MMPLYDFHCETCNCIFEAIQHIADRQFSKCPKCGNIMAKQIPCQPSKLAIFKPITLEDITERPITCNTKEEVEEACIKHGVYAPGVLDIDWKKRSDERKEEVEKKHGRIRTKGDYSETYLGSKNRSNR